MSLAKEVANERCVNAKASEVIPITEKDLLDFVEMRRYQRENPTLSALELFHWYLDRQGYSADKLDAIKQWPDGPRYNPGKR